MEALPAVTNAFGFAAGFNIQLWPFLRDLPQPEHLYGEKWMSILANCGLMQFFTPVDIQTAEYRREPQPHLCGKFLQAGAQ
jgi:type IV secretion system protein VirD4